MKTILFVTHKPKKCGIYEFGKNIFNVISSSEKYKFVKAECTSLKELNSEIENNQPQAIIYNYHPSVMPWMVSKISRGLYRNNVADIHIIQIGIIHEITQEVADTATGYSTTFILGPSQKKINSLFDFYIAPDPTLLLKNPLVFKTGRLIPEYKNSFPTPGIATIGSFGFGTPNKGFEKLVSKVQDEFDEAVIRLNIPPADFGDSDGSNARKIAENCRLIIKKENIQLDISHNFLNDIELLDFLALNSINVFMYEDTGGRGLSSALDNALAVDRPIAVSDSAMFRHILHTDALVRVNDLPLESIIQNGIGALKGITKDWNKENLKWEYDRILDAVFLRLETLGDQKKSFSGILRSKWKQVFSLPDTSFTWLRNTETLNEDVLTKAGGITYAPVELTTNGFNRILDDESRTLYSPTIDFLTSLVPLTMAKKISRANVQQAFVFDTVYRLSKQFSALRILCVGSYEDTASMSLQRIGYHVEEIDPMINYYLQEFYTKPDTVKNSYDIIFSTSVIEHDPDDKSFIECIEGLLASNGLAVLTCDYKDGWKPGEPKPDADARFYTKYDLENRLLSYLKNSELIDVPVWDCTHPDFTYLGKYQYTFATFVFRKKVS